VSEQGSTYAPGVSGETVGATALFLRLVTIPPGGRTKSHIHAEYEPPFYMLSGDEAELWTGDQLERNSTHEGCLMLDRRSRAGATESALCRWRRRTAARAQ
jgi:uncharacterized RmlC-like cupin family protein